MIFFFIQHQKDHMQFVFTGLIYQMQTQTQTKLDA